MPVAAALTYWSLDTVTTGRSISLTVLSGREMPPFKFKCRAGARVRVFGSTVDFMMVYGIGNVGPTWTLVISKDPVAQAGGSGGGGGGGGGGAQGLLALTRTQKDTLVTSFAPACPEGPSLSATAGSGNYGIGSALAPEQLNSEEPLTLVSLFHCGPCPTPIRVPLDP